MSYVPPYPVVPPMVSLFTPSIGYATYTMVTGAPVSATYAGSNLACYYPIRLAGAAVVRRLWWANGSSPSASYYIDVGVYAQSDHGPGARLVSTGATAQGTASQVQFVDVTDTFLAPGVYWIGLSASATGASLMRSSQRSNAADAGRLFTEASAHPLPATATPVENSTTYLYLCGFATTASP